MIYLKWLILALLDWALLLTVPFAAVIVPLFTREQPYGKAPYTWGWIWGTHDNPPQGDAGFVRKRSLFPGETTGLKGYVNRVHWMVRNNLYGYAKLASVPYIGGVDVSYIGNPNISDKDMRPGYYFAKAKYAGELLAFEFYCVLPWMSAKEFTVFGRTFKFKARDLRCRLGWKIMTDKYERFGFAQLVNTCNPIDGYGDE